MKNCFFLCVLAFKFNAVLAAPALASVKEHSPLPDDQGQLQNQKILRSEASKIYSYSGLVKANSRPEQGKHEFEIRPIGGLISTRPRDIWHDGSNPPITSDQMPNSVAAFEINGCGRAAFNGVYLPSQMQNKAQACTPMVWEKGAPPEDIYLLYNMNGVWVLDHRGVVPEYNAQDVGTCSPETATWASLGSAGSTPTSFFRRAAASFNDPNLGNSGNLNHINFNQTYFVVRGAGVAGFDGIYYMTPLVVVDQRCERTYAKDGPDKSEYTLVFHGEVGSDIGIWQLQSNIGGQLKSTYMGQDDGGCQPENIQQWTVAADIGGAAPSVVRSLTAGTTTTLGSATLNKDYVAGAAGQETTTSVGWDFPNAESTTTTFQGGCRGASQWWLRLSLLLSLMLALEGMSGRV